MESRFGIPIAIGASQCV